METRALGRSGIKVSSLCLGTMTFGNQTPEAEAHAQLDMALDAGVHFWDTAEMYPVNPVRAETIGGTEEILGRWFARTGRRSEVVLATKHTGDSRLVRDGAPISSATIPGTVEASLKRLQTDVIDLYQLHWPNRGSYMFRQNWSYAPAKRDRAAAVQDMADCLGALSREVERGTIRAIGLSNDTCWGTLQWLRLADAMGGPRVVSVQNEYSLMCRLYDTDMAEMSAYEDVGLLPFSPLAAGLLTGKYSGGAIPEGSRRSIGPELGGRWTDRAAGVADHYVALARKHGLDPVHMALAWAGQRPFVTAPIFGATTTAQLAHVLAGRDVVLTAELLDEIDQVHKAHPMPY